MRMDYTATDTGEGVTVRDSSGEVVATFQDAYNPAYLAFVRGLAQFPKASLFMEGRHVQVVWGGEIHDQETKDNLDEVQSEMTANPPY